MQPMNPNDVPVAEAADNSAGAQEPRQMLAVLTPQLGFDLSHMILFLNSIGVALPFAAQDHQGNLLNAAGAVVLPVHMRQHVTLVQTGANGTKPVQAPVVEEPVEPPHTPE